MAEPIARMIDDPSDTDGGPELPPWLEDVSIQIAANPTVVDHGQPTVVSWSVTLPTGGPQLQVRLRGEVVATSGSRTFTPPRKSTFTLLVSGTQLGVHAQTSRSVDVEVRYPSRVVINPSTPNPVQVLVGALTESTNCEQTVEMCNVDLDLTGFTHIVIGDNRSLIASPGCERSPRRLGPRIFVTDERGRAPLFLVQGDNVRISGFRLQGPTDGIGKGDRKEKGILISPAGVDAPLRKVEIHNMEIFHWSGVGVQVADFAWEQLVRGRLFNTNPGAVRIWGNFFHHNRHGAGEGYGVAVTDGAYATIEQNVFDENRHGIAGGSRHDTQLDYSGYTLRDNLILEGGGLHCLDRAGTGGLIGGIVGGIIGGIIGGIVGGLPGAILGAAAGAMIGGVIGSLIGSMCWQTHQIDMHGDTSTFFGGDGCCGTAGETMLIERNTILYVGGHTWVPIARHGLAIKIRGNPADKAVVDGNVFKHKSRSDAIAQNGNPGWGDNITNPIDVRPNNKFGVNPITDLGSGDYFGDGQMDQFMATGVTWWAKSPVTNQWRYLNTMSERLRQLELKKVDNDGVFDVLLRPPPGQSPSLYSKSGTGPWMPLPVAGGDIEPPIVLLSERTNGEALAETRLLQPVRSVASDCECQ